MAHVSTHDILSSDDLRVPGADRAPPARAKVPPVAEFYDLQPGERIARDAFRQARQLRDESRRARYARLKQG